MKIYIPKVRESWVVDRFRTEWLKNNKDSSTRFIRNSDIIWIIAPWLWKNISKKYLQTKKIICTIHHLEKNDFKGHKLSEFKERDVFVDYYHVISEKTKSELEKITKKPIIKIPFWVNNKLFYEIKDKEKLRSKFNIPNNSFLVGSFQRDTEGKDLLSPKLIKGPDRLVKIFKHLAELNPNLIVILAGKRRQYIINELSKEKINFLYFEMVSFETLNNLYNILDLYVVASRLEGGPQAIFECAIIKTPIISTDVGFASEILDENSIFNMNNFKFAKSNVNIARKNVNQYTIPKGFEKFINIFEELYNL